MPLPFSAPPAEAYSGRDRVWQDDTGLGCREHRHHEYGAHSAHMLLTGATVHPGGVHRVHQHLHFPDRMSFHNVRAKIQDLRALGLKCSAVCLSQAALRMQAEAKRPETKATLADC